MIEDKRNAENSNLVLSSSIRRYFDMQFSASGHCLNDYLFFSGSSQLHKSKKLLVDKIGIFSHASNRGNFKKMFSNIIVSNQSFERNSYVQNKVRFFEKIGVSRQKWSSLFFFYKFFTLILKLRSFNYSIFSFEYTVILFSSLIAILRNTWFSKNSITF